VFTQELLALMLELRAGGRPDAVLFLDGINDVFATIQHGEGGIPQNESKRSAEFQLGRQLDRTGVARGLRKDLKSIGILTLTTVKQLALVDWVLSLAPAPPPNLISADSAVRATSATYAANVQLVEALGKQYGFTPIYVWQPTIHATTKPLTPFEAGVMRSIKNDPTQARMQEMHLALPAKLDSTMATLAPGRFINGAGLFRNDSSEVYFDRVGHNTEASIPTIVDAFWPTLRAALVPKLSEVGASTSRATHQITR
jgi:hypothetical protein